MEENLLNFLLPIFLVGLIALILGGLLGALITLALHDGSTRKRSLISTNLEKVINLWRDRKSGKLVVEMDNQYYLAIGQMNTRRQNTLQQILDEMQFWLGAVDPGPRIMATTKSRLGEPEMKSSVLESAPQVPDALGTRLTDMPATAIVKPPSMELGDILSRVISPDDKIADPAKRESMSIAAQVDQILQERLPSTTLHARSIRLVDAPGKGLVVLVDGKSYESVGEVPDPEVRDLIQKCVADWEKTV